MSTFKALLLMPFVTPAFLAGIVYSAVADGFRVGVYTGKKLISEVTEMKP